MEAEKKAAAFAAELKRKEEEAQQRMEEFKAKQAAEAAAAGQPSPASTSYRAGIASARSPRNSSATLRWPRSSK